MNASRQTPASASFGARVYRDFALFALAAVAIGLAVSLTLATAIVLAAPEGVATAAERKAAESPRVARTRLATASLPAGAFRLS